MSRTYKNTSRAGDRHPHTEGGRGGEGGEGGKGRGGERRGGERRGEGGRGVFLLSGTGGAWPGLAKSAYVFCFFSFIYVLSYARVWEVVLFFCALLVPLFLCSCLGVCVHLRMLPVFF